MSDRSNEVRKTFVTVAAMVIFAFAVVASFVTGNSQIGIVAGPVIAILGLALVPAELIRRRDEQQRNDADRPDGGKATTLGEMAPRRDSGRSERTRTWWHFARGQVV